MSTASSASELWATALEQRYYNSLFLSFPPTTCDSRLKLQSAPQYVCRHYKTGIDVGYLAHPSFVQEDELENIGGPLSIAAAETDSIFPTDKRHQSEEILKKTGKPYQINLYSGVVHGFSVRGDMSKKIERFAKEAAFLQAVQWFDNWLLDA